ncbi:hypothetical protein E2320_022830 [Naja naja]|nr:hypothetical protein E2320_022830 [Naja naja]
MQVTLEQCTIDVLASQGFEYEVDKCVNKTINRPSMACCLCDTVCHYNCGLNTSLNEGFARCDIMDNQAQCCVCPGCCISSKHVHRSFYTKTNIVKEKKFHAELKRRYEEAKAKEKALEKNIESLNGKFDENRRGLKTSLDHSHQCLQNLREIALKPVVLSMPKDQELRLLSGKQELKALQFMMDMRRLRVHQYSNEITCKEAQDKKPEGLMPDTQIQAKEVDP